MKKIAIIGASYLQEPLITKAKEMGIQTHVFAWEAGDIGERIADFFYPISIVEKEKILEKCQEIGIDGICSIASDLAVITVNYVANRMNLVGNGEHSTLISTNKHEMRMAFERNNDPSPRSIMIHELSELQDKLVYPVIVKPLDRSGSRGITKVFNFNELENAIKVAEKQGFIKNALVEEFVEGKEYSVECVSYNGEHNLLAVTMKYTTGSPHFIETGHLEPAPISDDLERKIQNIVFHALNTLEIKNGASHSEIKIDGEGNIKIIEIGARMGGDFIGSSLVELSTGIDFVRAVIDIALGNKPNLSTKTGRVAGIHFVCGQPDLDTYRVLKKNNPEYIVSEDIPEDIEGNVTDSSTRFGFYIIAANAGTDISMYMPDIEEVADHE